MGYEHDRVVPGLINERDLGKIREAVCVQVEKVFDSCREKDCIENAPVLFPDSAKMRWIINNAVNVKCRRAEVLDVFADIEPVPFKRGFFTVDIKFFIGVTLDFFLPRRPGTVPTSVAGTDIIQRTGVILFDKKVILFGSEGNVKIFRARFVEGDVDEPISHRVQQGNQPISKVEVAEPICLDADIQDIRDKLFENCCCVSNLPRNVAELLRNYDDDGDTRDIRDEELPTRRVVATVGLFSIIKLVRLVQLLIPAFSYCPTNKECIAATEENPCELFDTIEFPLDEFFPPQIFDFPGTVEAEEDMKGKKGRGEQ
ncbi:hypothetical protein V6C42_08620 [Pseudoclostridium thermosuccinogenes]|uniref:hypothetical protein n=1 Tax=Clostridium thermosuccinogenes TaxID=84032 RepID=UPI000CCC5243|nr:hypothetical protein [Pseudoclostridium thermosuccinogenes]PNT91608.1 hypothetical protein CDQ83_17715 [Pseudoclostridium thermosuccinogenes]